MAIERILLLFRFFRRIHWLRRKDFRNVPSFGWLLAFPIVSSFKTLVILATLFNEAPSMRFIGASCFWLYSKRESPLESFLREYGEIGFEG